MRATVPVRAGRVRFELLTLAAVAFPHCHIRLSTIDYRLPTIDYGLSTVDLDTRTSGTRLCLCLRTATSRTTTMERRHPFSFPFCLSPFSRSLTPTTKFG
ncbi:hypothetical protein DENSPDRAFT_663431 [Dentipellis sp. KUC8613]|nr:hypothetical protein DENSPDRAFT_663431 [Dentipellis sp. KUC8613]